MVVVYSTKLNMSTVRGFQWTIQQTKFTSDMLLIPLGCCDLVLGVEWLVSLGDIVWNFNKLQMEFYVKGRRHVLRGAFTGLKTVKKQQLGKAMLTGVHLSILQVCDVQMGLLNSLTTQAVDKEVSHVVVKLLDEFSDLFQEPSGLPPSRPGHDH